MCSIAPCNRPRLKPEHVGGLVHYGGDLPELHVASLQGGGQHQAGGRGTEYPGQQSLRGAMSSAEACIWGARVPPRSPAKRAEGPV